MQWPTDFLPHSPAAPATVALLATVVLVLGRRGRRINDHPICRRCGFDLVGRPPDSAVCSECGADLRRRRAVRAGARRRVGGAVTAALLLLLPSLGILAFHGWHAYADVPFVQHKPVWWLLNDASSRDAVLRDDAFNELFRRFRSGRLSPPQVRQVAERALEIQGDLRRTWLPQWGDFVEEVQRAKQLPADQWRRFVGQAPQFELVATEQFKRGDRAWLELIERPSRVGATQDFIVRVHRRLLVADGRGNSFRRNFGAVTYYVGGSSRLQGGWSLPLNEGVIGRLSDGRHEARLEIIVEVLAGREAGILVTTRPSVATVEREFRTAWLVEKATAAESGVAVKDRE